MTRLVGDLTGKELADLCKVSVRTVECWRRRKQGPPYLRRLNGTIIYPIGPALDFIERYNGRPLDTEGKA